MSLAPGDRIGGYVVQDLLGEGGMGKVYRGRDTRLQRDVALKILPPDMALDPSRLARFEREAQILASLGHPNIAGILGVEDGPRGQALVLEFVDGRTLAEIIAGGRIPPDEACGIARQIADALEAAHEQGIVHRDLKPANIKVRPDGTVKVLDFGLAKALDPAQGARVDVEDLTRTSPAVTGVGVILGTAAYMSPEQARGKPVDKRADIWAFGCVFYEMLTGVRAFGADTVTDTLAAVVRSEPDWSRLPADVPEGIRKLLGRCLDKDPRKRLRDIGDTRFDLDDASIDSGIAAPSRSPAPRRALALSAFTAAIVIGMIVGVIVWRLRAPANDVVRLSIVPPLDAPLTGSNIAITPDGRAVVYVSGNGAQLSVRALDQSAPSHLANLGQPSYPFVSTDGRQIAFFDGLNALKTVPITGGPAVTVCALRGAAGRGGFWNTDGTIIFATDDPATGLWRVPASGGTPEALTTPKAGEGDHLWPQPLPGGESALVTLGRTSSAGTPQIAVIDLSSRDVNPLLAGMGARYISSGHLIFGAAGALRAVAFNPRSRKLSGAPVPVVEGIAGSGISGTSQAGALGIAVSDTGTLAYVVERGETSRQVVWVDRQNREELIPMPARAYVVPRLSPDGSRIALDTRDSGVGIWVWDLIRKSMTRVTFETSVYPVWTPDSQRIVHTTFDKGVGRLFIRAADGRAQPQQLTDGPRSRYASSLTLDGAWLLFREEAGDSGLDIGRLSLTDPTRMEALIKTPVNEMNPEVSHDGRWLAYESNQSGETQVYVRPFPDTGGGLWQVSTSGGRQPAWNPNGPELFFRAVDGTLMAVTVTTAPRFGVGMPQRMLERSYYTLGPYRSYDVSRDGKRFLMLKSSDDSQREPATIMIVQDWLAELERLTRQR